MNDLISEGHTSSCEIRGMPPSCSSVYYLSELRNPVYFTGSTPSVQTGYLIILHGYTIPKCIRSFNDFIIRDGTDTSSANVRTSQPMSVHIHRLRTSFVPKLVFSEVHGCTSLNKQRSRCPVYLQKIITLLYCCYEHST